MFKRRSVFFAIVLVLALFPIFHELRGDTQAEPSKAPDQKANSDAVGQAISLLENHKSDEAEINLVALGPKAVKPLVDLISRSQDQGVIQNACFILGYIGDPDGLPIVVKLLESKDVDTRACAERTFGFFGDKGAIKPEWIRAALKDSDWDVRLHGIISAGYVRDLGLVPDILALWDMPPANKGEAETRRYFIFRALTQMTGFEYRYTADRDIKDLQKDMQDFKDWWEKNKDKSRDELVIQQLQKEGYLDADFTLTPIGGVVPTEQVNKLGKAVRDKRWWIRYIAVKLLERIGDRRAQGYLEQALVPADNDTTDSIQASVAALSALRDAHDPLIIGPLCIALSAKPMTVNVMVELTRMTGETQGLKTSDDLATVMNRWSDWYGQVGNFLKWDKSEQKYVVDKEAQENRVPYILWSRFDKSTREKWKTMTEAEKETAAANAGLEFQKQKQLEDEAWAAGVRVDWWAKIPEESRKSWGNLSKEEREKLIKEAQVGPNA